jgi:hypothetical protein
MQQATERMDPAGAKRTKPGDLAVNNIAANPRVEAALSRDVHTVETVMQSKFDELTKQLKTEQANKKKNVDFVTAIRELDRDPTLTAAQRKPLYAAIAAEANVTTIQEPDASKLIGFFQTTTDEQQRAALTTAVNKHLKH